MEQAPIRDFRDLLAYLDGLAGAAAAGGADERMVSNLRTLGGRVRAIHNHLLPGQAVADAPTPTNPPPVGAEDTVTAFRELVTAAEQAGIHPTLVDFLRNAGHRLDNIARGVPDNRLAPRQPEEGEARLEDSDRTHAVRVAESSTFGLGVEIDTPLEADRVVRLVVQEAFGATTYECLTTHARPTANGYHLGLEIFAIRI
jgi:hypothetical protein